MLVHGVQLVLELSQHFSADSKCYHMTSKHSEHCGEIGRKMWMTPTGGMSLEFYDKMKYAFVLGSIAHIMYPAGVDGSDVASNPADAGADISAAEMLFLWEFDEALTELDAAHAKVMRLVRKQWMWQLDGYMCTIVELSGMAMEMQCLRGPLRTEHGAT